MNEGITRTDYGVSDETPSPACGVSRTETASFTLHGEPAPQPPPGFELLEEIGRGGMGLVYRARDLEFDREIALKFLQKKYELGSLHTLRFLDEAQITGQLQHPGIPAVHQVGKLPDGRPFMVMKLIKGYTLSELLWGKNRSAVMSQKPVASSEQDETVDGASTERATDEQHVPPHVIPKNYLAIFEAICQAMGYAHAHHVIHRDLKPQNIMVGAFGEVQVMDWGLAKVLKSNEGDTPVEFVDPQMARVLSSESKIQTSGSELTTAGSVLGTPSYMSPEQAIGATSQLDTRSDVFGLGGILCTLLTGKPPFQGASQEATRLLAARGMMGEVFERLDASGVEPDLIALAKRCLSPMREDRPENGGAVARAVAQLRIAADERAKLAELERTKAQVHAEEQRTRRRVMLIAAAVIICVLLIGIIGTTLGLFYAAAKEADATKAAQLARDANLAEKAQREQAELKEEETRQVLEFVEGKVFAAARPIGWEMALGRNVLLRDALLHALKNMTDDFKNKPLIEARVRKTLGSSFSYLGDYPTAVEQYERARKLYESKLGEHSQLTLMTAAAIAQLYEQQGRKQEAQQLREKTLRLAKEHHGEEFRGLLEKGKR